MVVDDLERAMDNLWDEVCTISTKTQPLTNNQCNNLLDPKNQVAKVMRRVLESPKLCSRMLGMTKDEFEELVAELLPKFRVLNKHGMPKTGDIVSEAKQLIGNREQLFIALFWMRKYQTMNEMGLLFDLLPQRVWRYIFN